MNVEAIFILMFVVATAVAIGARWLRLPYTVALVVAGLALGWAQLFPAPELTKELLFSVFLPGLIFEAAFHLDYAEFRRNAVTIVSLAVPGVVASIALTALILTPVIHLLDLGTSFTWRYALVFGALISATDPIAVIALFRTLGVPRRLAVLLDGESLLNDGTGIVFFTLSLSLLAGGIVNAGGLTADFVTIVGMGALLGLGVGSAVSLAIRHIDDPMIEITLTTIAAYGSFVTADQLGYSGVIATVAAGMVCGNFGASTGMSASTRVAVETFWEYVAFALNSIVFLLIGLEVQLDRLAGYLPAIVAAYIIVTLGRALVIQGGWAALRLTRERIPWRWSLVLSWGGLRGALPMVLVLSLPSDFAYHDLLTYMTFGVVILSILLQGLTMLPALTRLGIVHDRREQAAYEIARGRLRAADAALNEIERLRQRRQADPALLDGLAEGYRGALERARDDIDHLDIDRAALQDEEIRRVRRHLLLVEKKAVMEAARQGRLAAAAQEQLLAEIDARLLESESE